ncbi:MAG: hypothetical protein A2900_01075 [Candidatus Chisholmbacteria bacterium RIFCSPLOWO2_01_FULL_50_28]|uniref:Uncharacterized protein n=1 Tax=Candidatus Chisholmbacteria bacterium RIFCSPHIGHO2_01_FULL_52_32 TaxID=1797591 RepID=A0A1G1VV77_9BACT|nr:MAG: hypothetical protein A2786_06135 [Candidatus Chisholmbacteria bacterium RIFCSPHIGHO2_01_FULL_52_32]OGY19682.1 MAG: hypothetical protein A2900_01075 [Candidatus Chisholmbacteria bacterium RIFCSPLOWO2_01_FULL_50_28]
MVNPRTKTRRIELIFTDLDADLADAQNEDQKSLRQVQKELQKARTSLWQLAAQQHAYYSI